MKKQGRLLIFGGSGFLGGNWVYSTRDLWDVEFTYNSHFAHIPNASGYRFSSYGDDLIKFLNDRNPDLIINAAGLADVDVCEQEQRKAFEINSNLPTEIAIWAHEKKRRFVHVSTDHLFDGLRKIYTETDIAKPINVYGRSKLDGEKRVIEACPSSLVIRASFFGWGPSHRLSFSDKIFRVDDEQRKIQLSSNVFFSPVYVVDLINSVHELLNAGAAGIYNIASEPISKFDFARVLLCEFGKDLENLHDVRYAEASTKVVRPRQLSLSCHKAKSALPCFDLRVLEGIKKMKVDTQRAQQMQKLGALIPYGKHFLDGADVKSVVTALSSGTLTQGPTIVDFENEVAAKVGAKYAVAVSSATAGLHLSYLAMDLGKGDSVLTSPLTFVSTANAALFLNSRVSFCDVNPETLNMDPVAVNDYLRSNSDTKLVCNVLFGGSALGSEEIFKISRTHGAKVVEDAAHALGAKYSCGTPVGSCKYSDCAVFSLHPVKSIAAGEGGVITTNSEEIYKKLLMLRSHGITKGDQKFELEEQAFTGTQKNPWYYEMQTLGYHYRFTDIQAALARSQLKKLEKFVERRRVLAKNYINLLKEIPFVTPASKLSVDLSAMHIFPVRIDFEAINVSRALFMKRLSEKNIITQVHYIPVTSHPYYVRLGYKTSDFPNVFRYYAQALSIPLYYSLEDDEQEFVVASILEAAVAK